MTWEELATWDLFLLSFCDYNIKLFRVCILSVNKITKINKNYNSLQRFQVKYKCWWQKWEMWDENAVKTKEEEEKIASGYEMSEKNSSNKKLQKWHKIKTTIDVESLVPCTISALHLWKIYGVTWRVHSWWL